MRDRRRGFTLIEMMIVVLIITVLVSIAAIMTRKANQRAKEGTLLAGLKTIRDGIQLFANDIGGFPATLVELTATDSSGVSSGTDSFGGVRVPAGFNGPYLRQVPTDPATNSTSWTYAAGSGIVHSASSQTGSDGRPYSQW